jgi:hypothetical protein
VVFHNFRKIDILSFERWKGRERRQQDSRNRGTQNPKKGKKRKVPIREKGMIILLWSRELSGVLCCFTRGILIRTCGKTLLLCVCRIPRGGT